MKVFISIIILNIPLFLIAQIEGKDAYTVQIQGTFLSGKHYPAIAFEIRVNQRNNIKITLGGGPIASKKYRKRLTVIDTSINAYYQEGQLPQYDIFSQYGSLEIPIASTSFYTGAVLKISQLYVFYRSSGRKKISEITGGLDIGGYLLNDHYKQTVIKLKTNEQRYISGNYKSFAVSVGYTIGIKKTFRKVYYVSAFTNLSYYTPDVNKFFPPFYVYGEQSPFAWFKYELGIGIGYTFYK